MGYLKSINCLIKFPPLRPIVSHLNSNSCKLSEFIDSFLKYQAKRCKSFIRDTKDFLLKLKSIGKLPPNSILVTMDVSSLYTNINHEEGAQACFEKLQQRKNKRIPSLLLKNLILIVLKSNVFRFGNCIYQQIKGTAMGTPMAPNYANLFMDKFERTLIDDYRKKTGLTPLVWYRYIDDIFFIWTHGNDTLDDFTNFTQNVGESINMNLP